jgi:putative multiple sugar transport system permease protein
LVFRGLTQLILNGGQTLAPYPKSFLNLSTGFIPNFLSGNGEGFNTTSLILGIALAVVYCIVQILQRVRKASKGYAVENFVAFIAKQIILVAVIIVFGYLMGSYKGMPTVMIILAVLAVAYSYFTQNTVGGRQIYALGGNEKAARLSGINTKKVLFWTYVNMSVLAAVAGLVFTARLNAASPLAGQNFELDAIASCFIGGASTMGGTGTVFGAIVGALVMGIMNNGMSILGIGSDWQLVIKGLVLLLAVAFDIITKAKSKG